MRLVIKTVGPERMRELMSSTAGAGDGALLGQLVALSGPAGKASASKRFTAAASARGPGAALGATAATLPGGTIKEATRKARTGTQPFSTMGPPPGAGPHGSPSRIDQYYRNQHMN